MMIIKSITPKPEALILNASQLSHEKGWRLAGTDYVKQTSDVVFSVPRDNLSHLTARFSNGITIVDQNKLGVLDRGDRIEISASAGKTVLRIPPLFGQHFLSRGVVNFIQELYLDALDEAFDILCD